MPRDALFSLTDTQMTGRLLYVEQTDLLIKSIDSLLCQCIPHLYNQVVFLLNMLFLGQAHHFEDLGYPGLCSCHTSICTDP